MYRYEPLFALIVCSLRVIRLRSLHSLTLRLTLLFNCAHTPAVRRMSIQSAMEPDQQVASIVKAMLRKQPFPLIGLAILALVPVLGYLLLVTQRWAFSDGADLRRRAGDGASWVSDSGYNMEDSVFTVLFMIAIGEPYDVSDTFLDRVLALLTATIAAILTTMLINGLMQLIEADSATEAQLEDAALKMLTEEIQNAAGDFIRVQWNIHRQRRWFKSKSDKTESPERRALFKQLLESKQLFRRSLRRQADMTDDAAAEAASGHAKLQKVINQNNQKLAWTKQFKTQIFDKMDRQDHKETAMECRS